MELIEKQEDLKQVEKECLKEKEIAIDIECENHNYHFGTYISIIQISTPHVNYIIDVLKLKKIDPIIRILNNPNITKLFHNVSFDFRILNYEFGCIPKNIFDTEFAAQLLGKKEIGLCSLLHDYFNIEKDCKFQRANWTKRPINASMLRYAVRDTKYLMKLKAILKKELEKKGRYQWAKEGFKYLEEQEYAYKKPDYLDVRGAKAITPKERGVLKRLFMIREVYAKKVNRPVHYLIRNKRLLELAKNPPKTCEEWMKMKDVHPIVRNCSKRFIMEIQKGKSEPIELEVKKRPVYSCDEQARFKKLSDFREVLSEKFGVQKQFILSKDQMKVIVKDRSFNCLLNWQKELLQEAKIHS